ncbi:hypothetical protein [Deinococcus multiflagellatus]|uniref:Uncharacterized protein n=1 Tax=Deinococcus multiflagellatus TaxID=1656887 RepID=A0ABW1ZIV9_9DEIO|nr:hypothetical protein [Deinococcus multiflagellatus]MBZ9712596.1 hypothetical protein [Deinococcus multiflagellatus]
MLKAFARDLRVGTPAARQRAARRAYSLGVAQAAVPAVLVGLVQAAQGGAALPLGSRVAVAVLAAGLAAAAYVLARRSARRADVPAAQAALTAAFQSASVPGVPLLMAGAFVPTWGLVLALLVLAALAHGVVWRSLAGWVRPAGEGQPG